MPPTPRRARRASILSSTSPSKPKPPALRDPPPKRPRVESGKRRRTDEDDLNSRTDSEVWGLPDDEILAAAQKTWSADIYQHFNVALEREAASKTMTYVFTCKFHPDKPHPIRRLRCKTADGTSNLRKAANRCIERQAKAASTATSTPAPAPAAPTYDKYEHRAIIALRCSRDHRPFASVKDPLYQREVELLRPGTTLPCPSTVSRDVGTLHDAASSALQNYFQTILGCIHLVVDGWTSPMMMSFLGIVLVWYDAGSLHRVVLELARMTNRHTGEYMAEIIMDCLHRYGLAKKLYTICMDNAASNDSLVRALQRQIRLVQPNWLGKEYRIRCLPHTINLMAKTAVSFFFRAIRRSARSKIETRKRRNANDNQNPPTRQSSSIADMLDPEIVGSNDPEEDDNPVDPGAVLFENHEVSGNTAEAIGLCRKEGIVISERERQAALSIFPKVAGLAKKVHESPTLKSKFETIVEADVARGLLTTRRRALARRVKTRWNSDFGCLLAHVELRDQVEQLIRMEPDLGIYELTFEEWSLVDSLIPLLNIFDEPTKEFSTGTLPLIADYLPMLEDFEYQLELVYKDVTNPPVIRVAAKAALIVVSKYYASAEDCRILRIATGLDPTKKLQWARLNQWPIEQQIETRRVIIEEWESRYKPAAATAPSSRAQTPQVEQPLNPRFKYSKMSRSRKDITEEPTISFDSIESYLERAPVLTSVIHAHGGLLRYLESQRAVRPHVTQYQLDVLSTPVSSVEAERVFSIGRLTIGDNQHAMSTATFQAQISLGQWVDQPFMPSIEALSKSLGGKRNQNATASSED